MASGLLSLSNFQQILTCKGLTGTCCGSTKNESDDDLYNMTHRFVTYKTKVCSDKTTVYSHYNQTPLSPPEIRSAPTDSSENTHLFKLSHKPWPLSPSVIRYSSVYLCFLLVFLLLFGHLATASFVFCFFWLLKSTLEL